MLLKIFLGILTAVCLLSLTACDTVLPPPPSTIVPTLTSVPVPTAPPTATLGDFGIDIGRNMTHGSDSAENGANEVALWFKPDELVNWARDGERWVFKKI